MNKLKDMIISLFLNEQFAYLVAGGCTTLVNIISYWLLCEFTSWHYTICNVISIALAILFAFFANKIYVFRSKSASLKHWLTEFTKFVGARLSTMVIEVGGVWLLYGVIGIPNMIAKIATQFIVLVVNYFISKFFVFRKKEVCYDAEG